MKNKYLEEVLFTKKDIQNSIKNISKWVNSDLKGNRTATVVIGVLNGSAPFFGQLITQIKSPLITDFMRYSSFEGNDDRTSEPQLTLDITDATKKFIKGKKVLIVDDILSSGKTANEIYKHIMQYDPKEVKFVFLFDQKSKLRKPNTLMFEYKAALEAPDKFLVGFGLDYKQKYRNLDCVGILKEKFVK